MGLQIEPQCWTRVFQTHLTHVNMPLRPSNTETKATCRRKGLLGSQLQMGKGLPLQASVAASSRQGTWSMKLSVHSLNCKQEGKG